MKKTIIFGMRQLIPFPVAAQMIFVLFFKFFGREALRLCDRN